MSDKRQKNQLLVAFMEEYCWGRRERDPFSPVAAGANWAVEHPLAGMR